jgi:putative zinc finger/helix-turn-helix YgiT family protein
MLFRDVEIAVAAEVHVCPVCKLEAGTVEQTAGLQHSIADAYREKAGLLTGRQIRELRKKAHITQEELAAKTGAGIASIKRWEGAQIQTKSMDRALRGALIGISPAQDLTGGREFSIPRVKLVLTGFESRLGFRNLKKHDKMLFATKYLWYADMAAYRDLGTGMTGATYAALTYGPQLNNYRDLIDAIKEADAEKAEPLTAEEEALIIKICKAFPNEDKVYKAAHREVVWAKAPIGTIIPYSHAFKLSGI